MKTVLFSSMLDFEKSLIWPIGLKNGKMGTKEHFHLIYVITIFKAISCRGENIGDELKTPKCDDFTRVKHLTVFDYLLISFLTGKPSRLLLNMKVFFHQYQT